MRCLRGWWRVLSSALIGAACATATRSAQPVSFPREPWRIRIDIDSAPTRIPTKEPTFGTIDFLAHRHSIDFGRAITHRIPTGAYVVALAEAGQYKIILGDSASYDEKILMIGRAVTRDSIVGTWTETVVCCSAGGRFSLWRPERP